MKKGNLHLSIFALAMILLFEGIAWADPNENERINIIGYNPGGISDAILNLTYERALTEKISVPVTSGVWYYKDNQDFEFNNIWITGVNWFLYGRAPAGLFLGPRLLFAYSKEKRFDYPNDRVAYFVWAGGAAFGYHWIWDSGFSLGLGAGSLYLDFYEHRDSNEYYIGDFHEERWSGLFPYGEFFIGYSF